LPVIAFIRLARVAQLARLQQLSRTARLYRLRGLAMRVWRALVALEIIESLLVRNPERRLEKLEVRLADKLEEIEFLKQDIARMQRRVDELRERVGSDDDRAAEPAGIDAKAAGASLADNSGGETLAQPTV
jgi:voltage-gated potassium channel